MKMLNQPTSDRILQFQSDTRRWLYRWLSAAVLMVLPVDPPAQGVRAGTPAPEPTIAAAIDVHVQQRLDERGINPAPQCSDSILVRRITLDLLGRVPTLREARAFVDAPQGNKREQLVDRLMQSPEYVRHSAREFDRLLNGENESAPSLETYLQAAIRERKTWDRMVSELLGVSDPVQDDAARFVIGRLGDRDALTRDVSSVLFGVNMSCCQCHDHPSVTQLTQDYYYGMKAFFHRSYDFQGRLVDRAVAQPLVFEARDGQKRVARLLLVSGKEFQLPPVDSGDLAQKIEAEDKVIADLRQQFAEKKAYPDPPSVVPRRLLVETALQSDQRMWLAKSLVNRLWYRLLGHGLVMRVDQMHTENPASHPELLDWLARDLVDHGYDFHRTIRGILLSQTYSRSSLWTGDGVPAADLFAVAQARPLTPMQYGLSIRVASSPDLMSGDQTPEQFDQKLVQLETEAKTVFFPLLPQPIDGLQIGADEALRMSNDESLLKLLGDGLAASLTRCSTAGQCIDQLYWTVYSRPAEPDEMHDIQVFLAEQQAGLTPTLLAKGARRDRSGQPSEGAPNTEVAKAETTPPPPTAVDWLSDDERAVLDRYENRLQQVAWAMFTGAEFRFNH